METNKEKNAKKLFKGFEIRFLKTTFNIILGALAALAWETALSEILKRYIPDNPSPLYWILYALVLTVIIVILGAIASRIITRAEKKLGTSDENNEK